MLANSAPAGSDVQVKSDKLLLLALGLVCDSLTWCHPTACYSIDVTAQVSNWCCHVILAGHMVSGSICITRWTSQVYPVRCCNVIALVGCKLWGWAGFSAKQGVLEVLWLGIIHGEGRCAVLLFCYWRLQDAGRS